MSHTQSFLRRTELLGIVAALLFTVFALLFAQMGLSYQRSIHIAMGEGVQNLLLLYGALLVASLFLGLRRPHADQRLLPLVSLLGGLGLVFLYRLPIYSAEAVSRGADPYHVGNLGLMASQSQKFVLGTLAMLLVAWSPVPLRWWRNHRTCVFVAGLAMLPLIRILGSEASEQQLALDLKFISFQPVELIKVLFIGYVASYLADHQSALGRMVYRGKLALPWLPVLLPLGITLALALAFLVLLKDMGAMLVFLGLFPVLCYVGFHDRTFRYVATVATALVLVGLLIVPRSQGEGCFLPENACNRIEAWRDPFGLVLKEPRLAEQIVGAYYGMAAGGLLGQGLGMGWPAAVTMSVLESDMIFVGMIEDLGFVGAVVVLSLYLLFLWRGLEIARAQGELYDKLLATGIVALFATQLLVILGGNLGLLPLTGITVPFLSSGGTSLLVNMALVGILLSLSTAQPLRTEDKAWGAIQQRILHVRWLYVAAFLVLTLGVAYWTLVRAESFTPQQESFEATNTPARQRRAAWLARVERGLIVARDGSLLSGNGEGGRIYHDPSLVHTLGQVRGGTSEGVSGLEYQYNAELLGRGNWNPLVLLARRFNGRWEGNSLRLTIEPRWQQAAEEALGDYSGSVVVLDAHSGAVLAMVSHPLFEPTLLNEEEQNKEQINRAIQELYPPGSTFKTVVGAMALEQRLVQPDTRFDYSSDLWEGNCHSRLYGGNPVSSCNTPGYLPQMTFSEGYYWSDNLVFADLATRLGAEQFRAGSAAWGFGEEMPFDLPVAVSRVATDDLALQENDRLARSGFGQEDVVATPLQMALVAATVANKGVVPRPYVVEAILAPDGGSVRATRPRPWRRAISERTAAQMVDVMRLSALEGWASSAYVEGMDLGGKTGTAEWAGSLVGALPHSWYIGFATLPDARTIAFAIIVEQGGQGNTVAGPLVREMLNSYR